ncbi:YqjF family protein [Stackebrandtia soli]|uniref:YqjF family protein n=1 Tax=Stackebrandtia soli TaxID=1892856 RepID=UPI0039E91397
MTSRIEPVTPEAPRTVRRSVLAQWWRQVTFVHWAVDPEAAQRLLPSGLRPDMIDGVTYVGLVAFRMDRSRVLGLPPAPYLGGFAETNVRLYTVDESGRRGVLFRSMDATRLVPVLIARTLLGLPYRWSKMRLDDTGDRISYTCRPGRTGQVSHLEVATGKPIDSPSPLELFLTARWGMHSRGGYLATEHPTWPLRKATILTCDDHLVEAAGLPGITREPPASALYSPGVPVRFGPVARGPRSG